MMHIEEIMPSDLDDFWNLHIHYLIEDELIHDEADISYFSGSEYRGILEKHMIREQDKQHMVYFCKGTQRIGAASYCTYQSEDGKCFILDFWVFPEFRGNGAGHQCFEALETHTRLDGAHYYALNSEKENSIRFWKSLGFVEDSQDEHDMLLLIKK